MKSTRFLQGRVPVPFITPWEMETELPSLFIVGKGPNGQRLAYGDEVPGDRDDFGVLWVRRRYNPGQGSAKFHGVHPHRQRLAMFRGWCQVGGGSVLEINGERQLYLMKASDELGPPTDGDPTWVPPICVPCALTSVRLCPHLRDHTAVWAEYAPSWGVMGVRYDPRSLRPVPNMDLVQLPYGDPRTNWVLAARLMVQLYGVSVADLRSLAPGETACQPVPEPAGSGVP